jgi:hypothetical protein
MDLRGHQFDIRKLQRSKFHKDSSAMVLRIGILAVRGCTFQRQSDRCPAAGAMRRRGTTGKPCFTATNMKGLRPVRPAIAA